MYIYIYTSHIHIQTCIRTNIIANNKVSTATVNHSKVLLISRIIWPTDYPPTALEVASVGQCGAAREQQHVSDKELFSPNKQDVERHWILGLCEPPTYCETRPAAPIHEP